MPKRIAFSESDASHIYEWLRMYWLGDEDGLFGLCYQCETIGRRLETMLGPKEVARIARVVRKHPGKRVA
jgi:hypothetical protein